ncbi:hypothetical protein L291_3355 [Acinetobacter guillouiae MSP4-18]|uniref:hypothetical protein n=1 Tax=Acinetobacter guillouiae TaxID=106649 RepID=UPI0002CEFC1F|nr:hypothetical protein [Acinetobacter guillouiae]ENU59417.1 hypothetical protein F981_01515 [Acinetobacter guillouiae CIP 63.46]EPH32308.1 hypothetical protein L291_3355 [Acinetobacter guillouiae MSP4-18]KAB0628274.1 hypothetical protein F7P82_06770 [Acinetobacter guillouiae]
MIYRFSLTLCSIVLSSGLSTQSFAEPSTQKLTQEQYDQRIQTYTDQVNETKHILDEAHSTITAIEQHQAFCSRLDAYQAIARISKENLELDTANMMLVIANNFLDRQKQSIEQSGMTFERFCSIKK